MRNASTPQLLSKAAPSYARPSNNQEFLQYRALRDFPGTTEAQIERYRGSSIIVKSEIHSSVYTFGSSLLLSYVISIHRRNRLACRIRNSSI